MKKNYFVWDIPEKVFYALIRKYKIAGKKLVETTSAESLVFVEIPEHGLLCLQKTTKKNNALYFWAGKTKSSYCNGSGKKRNFYEFSRKASWMMRGYRRISDAGELDSIFERIPAEELDLQLPYSSVIWDIGKLGRKLLNHPNCDKSRMQI